MLVEQKSYKDVNWVVSLTFDSRFFYNLRSQQANTYSKSTVEAITKLIFTCSKWTIETVEKGMKCLKS